MSGRPSAILAIHDKVSREAFCSLLPEAGLEAQEARGEAAILSAAASERAAVVLLDADLPDHDALITCRRLKADPGCLAPVILRVPAAVSDSRKQAALAAEADGWLLEPSGRDIALATLRAAHKLAIQRQQLSESMQRVRSLEALVETSQAQLELFASQACHDVEEPLRGISTFAELIAERPGGTISDEDRNYLRYILASGNRFRRLLRSVLLYSRVGRRKPQGIAPIPLRSVVDASLQSLRKMVEESGAAVDIEDSLPHVYGDFNELQQVFEQLIGNAILYGRRGAAASVKIGSTQSQPTECTIWIADNGPGVPEDRRNVIFEPFKRLHGHETPGSGMGLAIARRIVDACGGRIWVEPAPDGGARVCFVLPEASRA